ncbi:isoprenyl transferase [Marivirga harenae]|uniref:isoprenyl transferase n=1 Tax=Marivirga harenae TaxID=2010992 RepID=UPI0026DEC8CF|nr:isoprenyl transferase [Marivirga harenae]WKV13696.1 isoprenyl transferase [Marivirga harenae]|tara:strand:+ start:64780 stop:65508 length:729 start_codon:yes stop_codon:yes gene_type:complete
MEKNLDKNNLPKHVAVIMDGNGRWAKKQGAARVFGHKNAIKSVRDTVEGCAELGISHLSLYAFSTENWGRPKIEVDALMQLLVATIKSEMKTLMENDVRLTSIGDIEKLPGKCYKELQTAKEETANNKGLNLILALNYSGKWDITQACRKAIYESEHKGFKNEDLTDLKFESYLSTAGIPDPELLIRTSGEFRISNFMLWQLAYSEIYITEVLWPDFRKEHLHEALLNYQSRERRFGKVLSE